jgi:hypothetical protein
MLAVPHSFFLNEDLKVINITGLLEVVVKVIL